MYLVREIFNTKPGKAKELVAKFKKTEPYMKESGAINFKIMTDISVDYWTVVVESETETLDNYLTGSRNTPAEKEMSEIMQGYLELLIGGRREIFKLE